MQTIPHLKLWSFLLITRPLYLNSAFLKSSPQLLQGLVTPKTSQQLPKNTAEEFFNNLAVNQEENPKQFSPLSKTSKLIQKNPTQDFLEKLFTHQEKKYQEAPTQFDASEISEVEAEANSEQFLKYLAHSLRKGRGQAIIKTVEHYCRQKKHLEFAISKEKDNKKKVIADKSRKAEQTMFKDIKKILMKEINVVDERVKINYEYILSLLVCLSRSNPHIITLQNYQTHLNYAEGQDSQPTLEKKFRILDDINSNFDISKYSTEPEPENVVEDDKYRKSLELALKKGKEKNPWVKPKRVMTYQKLQKHQYTGQIKLADENMVYHKVGNPITDASSMEENNKYAYVYELPYDANNQDAKHFIKYLQQTHKIRIQSFILFSYLNYLQKNHHEITYQVPDNFMSQKLQIQKIYKDIKIDTKNHRKDPKQNKKSGGEEKKSITEALLSKIKRDHFSKFNKSTMIIKFASVEDKCKVLTPEARLFGINYQYFRNIKIEQGFCKTMVSLHGIPNECNTVDLQDELNKIFAPLNISIQCDEEAILQKFVYLKFDTLTEALKAIKLLNKATIFNKKLKAGLTYGPCKIFKNEYENQVANSYDLLKKKIKQSCHKYSQRFQEEDSLNL